MFHLRKLKNWKIQIYCGCQDEVNILLRIESQTFFIIFLSVAYLISLPGWIKTRRHKKVQFWAAHWNTGFRGPTGNQLPSLDCFRFASAAEWSKVLDLDCGLISQWTHTSESRSIYCAFLFKKNMWRHTKSLHTINPQRQGRRGRPDT